MSMHLAALAALDPRKKLTRTQTIALRKAKVYNDGRTKQCHKDECDINKIMARFDITGTISHLQKFEGVYADFSDFDFHTQLENSLKGEKYSMPYQPKSEGSSANLPAKFFEFVNDPANANDLRAKLPALARPGQQLPPEVSPTADSEAALAAANTPDPNATPAPEASPSSAQPVVEAT